MSAPSVVIEVSSRDNCVTVLTDGVETFSVVCSSFRKAYRMAKSEAKALRHSVPRPRKISVSIV